MFSAAKTAAPSAGGYTLSRSLRLRSSASAYLNKTYSAAQTNAKIQTFSWWTKRGVLSAVHDFFGAYDGSSATAFTVYFAANDTFNFDFGGASTNTLTTTQVFRDPSAWYHFVLAIDTTQATASNRYKLYVNGTQVTAFSTANYVAQNSNSPFGTNNANNRIGTNWNNASQFLDGYLAEVNFIDGQALTPSSFGSTNTLTGVWQPARYTGTYGTNGFYLPFSTVGSSTYAASFNGSNQLVYAPASSNLALNADLTIEAWVYPTTTSGTRTIVESRSSPSSNNGYGFGISTTNTLFVYSNGFLGTSSALTPNAWNHVAWVRSGSANTIYINGVSSGTFTDSRNFSDPSTNVTYIGGNPVPEYYTGSISNVRIVKGTAVYTANFTPPSAPLTAISGTQLLTLQNATIIDNSANAFTITNINSVTTSVVYPFVASIGSDASGNGNNWTSNNISLTPGATYDSMTDVPTLTSATAANFAVLNPLDKGSNVSVTEGNLLATISSTGGVVLSSIGISSGKWYWEMTRNGGADCVIGIAKSSVSRTAYLGSDANGWGYIGSNGNKVNNGSSASYGSSYATNIVIGVALDMDSGTVTFYRNNVSQGTAYSSLTGTIYAAFGTGNNTDSVYANFGQRPFTYTPPTGFVALNTYNLPTSTVLQGNKVMDATLYTGNGSTQSIVNAAGFKPDLVWYKARSFAYDNSLFDSVRGASNQLVSNLTQAETSLSGVTSFNSNGFTLGSSVNGNNGTSTYVAWQWQAGQGTTSSNTSGTITSTVSVNASAGFSVVTYTGNGTNPSTVGHGLGVAPSMVIVKNRNSTLYNWNSYHISLGNTQYIALNTTDAASSAVSLWNNTTPTSSVFTVNHAAVNTSGNTLVAYCFAPIAGYSAFGSYTGNGSTDGTFIYLGFRPKFFMLKVTNAVNAWLIVDSARNTYNVMGNYLIPNASDAEGSATLMDFVSNGVKMRNTFNGWNASGETFIYAAFAENPFKNSLAR